MKPRSRLASTISAACLLLACAYWLLPQVYQPCPDAGKLGGPIPGLTAEQARKFYASKELFMHEFSPEEGLGPLFNGRSCFECHGQPGPPGGEGRDVSSTGVVRIGTRFASGPRGKARLKDVITDLTFMDVDLMETKGGPALQRKSITSEFPSKYPVDCQIEIGTVPKGTELLSMRHAGPLFGFGLINSIPDAYLVRLALKQQREHPELAGRLITHSDPLTNQARVGRFGWKNQNSTLQAFTMEALNVEMGVTTYTNAVSKSARGVASFPSCISKFLPPELDDKGSITNKLTYFQTMLAAPERGEITPAVRRGKRLFERMQCAVCHVPEMSTAKVVYVADPDSPAPQLRYMEVKALENQPVRAYSDFLLHQMGPELADGLPQAGARGGEWRTTPLWGLRLKRFYLHDGRTSDLAEAVSLHAGQAKAASRLFKQLPPAEKEDLIAFLRSL